MKKHITENARETKKLGAELSGKLRGGEIFALSGNLGSGKTTFAQGLLEGLGVKGPHTSPTFVVLKHYKIKIPNSRSQFPNKSKILNTKYEIRNIYHVDAYRVTSKDLLNLGWKELITGKNNVIIVEWADRVKKIIPRKSIWIKFKWLGENKREITFSSPAGK